MSITRYTKFNVQVIGKGEGPYTLTEVFSDKDEPLVGNGACARYLAEAAAIAPKMLALLEDVLAENDNLIDPVSNGQVSPKLMQKMMDLIEEAKKR